MSNILHFVSFDKEEIAIENILDCLKPKGICYISIVTKKKFEENIKKRNSEEDIKDFFYWNSDLNVIFKHPFQEKKEWFLYNEERIEKLISNFKVIKKLDSKISNTSECYILGPKNYTP